MNNFVSVFEELNKLYEADELEQDVAVEDADAEVVDEAPAAEGPKQLVLECSKCGAVCVKLEDDVVIDEATDLANVEEECAGCEEAAGYMVLGELLPYAADGTEGEAEDEGEDFEESVDPEAAAQSAESEPTPEAADETADPGDPGSPADKEDISEELLESVLTEGKFMDNVKKVVTRVGADASTILRCFTELGEMVKNIGNDGEHKTTKLNDFMEYIENKAVLKALMNGNEEVLNGTTKEEIEELAQDIEEYKKAKAGTDDADADAE